MLKLLHELGERRIQTPRPARQELCAGIWHFGASCDNDHATHHQ